MASLARWRAHLPNFDPDYLIEKEQRNTSNALRRLSRDQRSMGWEHLSMRNCTEAERCRGGLCPRCIRQLRVNLLDFLESERLHLLCWHFVTIRVEGWKVEPGNLEPFGRLHDHPYIYNLMTKFRRMKLPGLVVFGSIETVYNTVANIPTGKPFHLHLMVSGASEVKIDTAVKATIPLSDDIVPLDIRPVSPTDADFFEAASYAFKQPLLKRSKIREGDRGALQRPNAAERCELISNLGMHGWQGRLILLGIRCDNGQFRLTADLSTTARRADSARLRKQPNRRERQVPGWPSS
ncbi:hypothetical protein NKH34_09120 [Mesorhizobium sp. M1148]|uniref:hypothetical protein n=1 Tax=unclassified Mesorhizobium TaxID=325217 RepID=UPI00333697AB